MRRLFFASAALILAGGGARAQPVTAAQLDSLITQTVAASPQTMFALGSVTKQFTCALALMLAEQGKLSFSDPVAKWYPNLTRAKDITLLDIGGNRSGDRDYYPLDFVDQEMQKPATPDEIIDRYATRPLDFEPRSMPASADLPTIAGAPALVAARKALSAMGPISNVRVSATGERGGMEVATVLFDVGNTTARGLMYRTPDGKIQEFLFSRN